VKAQYCGRGPHLPGKIEKSNDDGTYAVRYDDDSDVEENVEEKLIRVPAKFFEGQKVEARCGGRGPHLPGEIKKSNGDGTYDVRYDDDSDVEENVKEKLIRVPPKFFEGQKVEARYGGRGPHSPGEIKKSNGDGTYNIRYDDDSDVEEKVEEKCIRARAKFFEGQKVEARYCGRGPHLPGEIERSNGDGTYDVRYDGYDDNDGLETNVDEKQIRPLPPRFADDQKVEAQSGGRGPHLPGRIETSNGDRTYSVRFDESDELEQNVEEKCIRSVPKFSQGQRVKARWGGRAKYHDGKIEKSNGDGTYDVRYADNGDVEKHVAEELILPLPPFFFKRQKVEARHGGRGRWYHGVIEMCHGDGTYDVRYLNSVAVEKNVNESLIRALAQKGSHRNPLLHGLGDDVSESPKRNGRGGRDGGRSSSGDSALPDDDETIGRRDRESFASQGPSPGDVVAFASPVARSPPSSRRASRSSNESIRSARRGSARDQSPSHRDNGRGRGGAAAGIRDSRFTPDPDAKADGRTIPDDFLFFTPVKATPESSPTPRRRSSSFNSSPRSLRSVRDQSPLRRNSGRSGHSDTEAPSLGRSPSRGKPTPRRRGSTGSNPQSADSQDEAFTGFRGNSGPVWRP